MCQDGHLALGNVPSSVQDSFTYKGKVDMKIDSIDVDVAVRCYLWRSSTNDDVVKDNSELLPLLYLIINHRQLRMVLMTAANQDRGRNTELSLTTLFMDEPLTQFDKLKSVDSA